MAFQVSVDIMMTFHSDQFERCSGWMQSSGLPEVVPRLEQIVACHRKTSRQRRSALESIRSTHSLLLVDSRPSPRCLNCAKHERSTTPSRYPWLFSRQPSPTTSPGLNSPLVLTHV